MRGSRPRISHALNPGYKHWNLRRNLMLTLYYAPGTCALASHIALAHPAAKLAPLDDPYRLGKAQAFNLYLCSTVHVAHAHRMRGARWADEPEAHLAMQRKVPQTVGDCFALIEREMFDGPWVMG